MCMYGHIHRLMSFLSVLTVILIIPNSFPFEIIFFERRQRTFIFSSMYMDLCVCAHTHTHANILVCQTLLSVLGNMCSHRMERSHLHPPCIFSPGSKLLGNEFPKEKKKKISQSQRPTSLSMELLCSCLQNSHC